jgi:hypothetical protein
MLPVKVWRARDDLLRLNEYSRTNNSLALEKNQVA